MDAVGDFDAILAVVGVFFSNILDFLEHLEEVVYYEVYRRPGLTLSLLQGRRIIGWGLYNRFERSVSHKEVVDREV